VHPGNNCAGSSEIGCADSQAKSTPSVGLRPIEGYGVNQIGVREGRAAVASVSTRHAATTERGPPDHLKSCAQNAHKFRRKGATPATAATKPC